MQPFYTALDAAEARIQAQAPAQDQVAIEGGEPTPPTADAGVGIGEVGSPDKWHDAIKKTIPAEVTGILGIFVGVDLLPQWNWALVLIGMLASAAFAFFLYSDVQIKRRKSFVVLHILLAAASFLVLMIGLQGDRLDVFAEGTAPSDFISNGQTRLILAVLYVGIAIPLAYKAVERIELSRHPAAPKA